MPTERAGSTAQTVLFGLYRGGAAWLGASMPTGRFVEVAAADGLLLSEYRCNACRGERPFPEEHRAVSAALVLSGSFGYALRGQRHLLVPGALLLLVELLLELRRRTGSRPLDSAGARPPTAGDIERALCAVDFIEAHAAQPLSLSEVAAEVDLSPFHFLRLFRRVIGLTPHQVLVHTRIRHAARALLEGEPRASVTDIAYQVGFGDLSNFVRTFGRLVGCSPLRLRRGGLRAQRKILQERLRPVR